MEQNPIFVEHPQLKVVYGTSDGEFFYNSNDAQNHAKNLSDKKVEPVYNPNHLEVAEEEFLEETTQEAPAEEVTTDEAPAEEVTNDEVTTEEAPAETVTTEEATAEEVTTEEVTTEEAPADTVTTEEVTTEEAPAEEVTNEEAPAETVTTEEVTTEEAPAVEASSLDDRLRAFDPESTEYAEALDLFIDLKLVAASRKKVDVYAALSAAKSQLK